MTLPVGPVAGGTKLYRRIPPSWLTPDEDRGCRRISSAAFRDKEASIFLADVLDQLKKDPSDILVGSHAGDYLVSVTADDAFEFEQEVKRSPVEGVAEGDVQQAHGEVSGSKEKKFDGVRVKHHLCRRALWVVAPDDACPDAQGGTGGPSGSADRR
ncbi:hypothetical protein OM076_04790 [Solirubrobacter ginsenosidimutans]|uniref:Uncharacterized protein n=1 Tax=Solirubrobacter ginsenosidimutans TaxID=490573 RepID=A0A9X3S029_9ACTN|nr:hypothetical protein [Solirubrobacter ginsenosidimutans]MDA0159572.1 hypothetical protein [Solirubrobacter ginsenosidimutans]